MGSNYGERLKKYRIAAGLKQNQLANKLGIDATVLSNWERGKNRFDVDYIPAICDALNITANDLLGYYTDYSLNPEEEKLIQAFRKIGSPANHIFLDMANAMISYRESSLSENKKPEIYLAAASGTKGMNDEDLEKVNQDIQNILDEDD